jgi:glycosyltransferase involved in cell wall biosynthesis
MKTSPLVTVGLPFRNPGMAIVEAIQSVFAQTAQDWELILVNDGSEDASLELARRIEDPRVRLVDDGMSLGLPRRLNQIADLAAGTFIARMDADDMMHPERIAKQVSFLQGHPDVDIVDTGSVILDRMRQPVGVRGLDRAGPPDTVSALKWGVVLHASVMVRAPWQAENQYDPGFPRAEDRELFVRVLGHSSFAHIPEPLFFNYVVGNVRLGAFLLGYRSERRVLLRYAPGLVGWPMTFALWGRSAAKSAAVRLLVAAHRQHLVTRRAYVPITPEVAGMTCQAISRIRQQKVPGWPT